VIPSLIISILYYSHICLPFELFFILDPYLTMEIMVHSKKSVSTKVSKEIILFQQQECKFKSVM